MFARTRLACALSLLASAHLASQSPPVIAGLESHGLDPAPAGAVLVNELGCATCHDAGRHASWIDSRTAPRLVDVARRLKSSYVRVFLENPHRTKPGTTMPDVLHTLTERVREQTVVALTHYLASRGATREPATPFDGRASNRGRVLFHEIGCAACHAPRDENGRELAIDASVPLGNLGAKYRFRGLLQFLEAPHDTRPSARMPDFGLSPQEAYDLTHYLIGNREDEQPMTVDARQAEFGAKHYRVLGCAQCHEPDATPPDGLAALDAVKPARGCLSAEPGRGPAFGLSESQRAAIRQALAAKAESFDDETRIQMTLASRNCVACHERGDFGGIRPERNEYFTTADGNLGEAGRLPPTLTGVGAKLRAEWLENTIAYGQAIRPYVKTRMPGFGKALGESLTAHFKRVDRIEPANFEPLPRNRKERGAIRDLGHKLVGNEGMACIACHTFRGETDGMAGVDIADSTVKRLEPDWFYRYMLDPIAFQPGTIMPRFFPNGESTRKDLGDGDAKRQIHAIWHYLSEGRNARKPRGISRKPIEITVGDEAVMLRRSVQGAGKRGISVGYPRGVNITFDAESMAMTQIWWGKFLDAAPVFTGQGSGQARPLSRHRLVLPNGPAIVSKLEEPWTTKSRRELGHRFLGYDLDEKRRPIFRYACDDVGVQDHAEAVQVDKGKVVLRRTLTFTGEGEKSMHLLITRGKELEAVGDDAVRIGPRWLVRASGGTSRLRKTGDDQEFIVTTELRDGRAEVVVYYHQTEENR